MELSTIIIIAVIILIIIFFGRLIGHALRIAFYVVLVFLIISLIFHVSFGDIWNFIKNLVFAAF